MASKRAADSNGGPSPKKQKGGRSAADEEALNAFKSFLSIKSVSYEGPKGAYQEAVTFLEVEAKKAGFTTKVISPVESKPILICTLQGTDPSLPAVLLNSHYDVVPAVNEMWDTDPFTPVEDEKGDIYARGTQDMKCVCMQYLEAIKRLRQANATFKRTIYATFVPDEEVGGVHGMGELIKTADYKAMNVGVALDEGLANPDDAYTVFYGERAIWWVKVKSEGAAGHASRFIEDTAVPKLLAFLNKVTAYREEQEALLKDGGGCAHAKAKKLGDVQTINITMLDAGEATIAPDGRKLHPLNVIPVVAQAGFDTRIPPNMPLEEFKKKLEGWAAETGVSWEFVTYTPAHGVTSIDRSGNPWWRLLEDTLKGEGVPVVPEIFPAATDSRFLRQIGVPAFGFSPMRNTPILLHDHNERLNATVYLEGIKVYEKLIPEFANAGPEVKCA